MVSPKKTQTEVISNKGDPNSEPRSGTLLYIGGGLLAAGGAAAAVALSGGEEGGSDGGTPAEDSAAFGGRWRGTWNSTAGDAGGDMVLLIDQKDAVLTGSATITGWNCMTESDVSGRADGEAVRLDLTGSQGSAVFNARADTAAGTMAGTLSSESCADEDISINLTKAGGVHVTW